MKSGDLLSLRHGRPTARESHRFAARSPSRFCWLSFRDALGTGTDEPFTAALRTEPALVWKTSGSVTFAAADGATFWLIEASGGLGAPKASLVRIGPAGVSRVVTFPGYAYGPAADKDYVYLVVDKDIVRVDKRRRMR